MKDYLSRQITKGATVNSRFERHILGPLIVLISLILWELGTLFLGWPITLGVTEPIMVLTIFRWSGLRASLVSALFISLYLFYHLEYYGSDRALWLAAGAFLIVLPSGALKRVLREKAIEAEHYRLQLLDTFNGNKAKLQEAIKLLDELRDGWKTIPNGERLKRVEQTRGRLADLVLLVDSYHQMAEDRRLVETEDKK